MEKFPGTLHCLPYPVSLTFYLCFNRPFDFILFVFQPFSGTWTNDEMKGVLKYAEVKEIFEYMLDQMIDERISEVLLKWETKYKVIGDIQGRFAEGVYHTFQIFNQRLDVLERDLHCTDSTDSGNGDNEARLKEMGHALMEVKRFVASIIPGQKADFKVNYSVVHGHDIINGKAFEVGKKLKKLFKYERVQKVPNRYSTSFQKDLQQHMEYRTKAVVERLSTEEYTSVIIKEQFVPINTYFQQKANSFKRRLNQNLALVKNLSKNVDFVVGNNRWYETYTETLKNLFDNVWSFSFKYMKTDSYEDSELVPYDGKQISFLCLLTCQSADIMPSLCGVCVRVHVHVNDLSSKTTRPRDMLFVLKDSLSI